MLNKIVQFLICQSTLEQVETGNTNTYRSFNIQMGDNEKIGITAYFDKVHLYFSNDVEDGIKTIDKEALSFYLLPFMAEQIENRHFLKRLTIFLLDNFDYPAVFENDDLAIVFYGDYTASESGDRCAIKMDIPSDVYKMAKESFKHYVDINSKALNSFYNRFYEELGTNLEGYIKSALESNLLYTFIFGGDPEEVTFQYDEDTGFLTERGIKISVETEDKFLEKVGSELINELDYETYGTNISKSGLLRAMLTDNPAWSIRIYPKLMTKVDEEGVVSTALVGENGMALVFR